MKRKICMNLFGWLFVAAATIVSCNDDDEKEVASLYTRLGGTDAIALVVDDFLNIVATDNRINARFVPTIQNNRLTALRNNLIDQICEGTGGPCQYKGQTMLAAHQGMNITEAEFNALVEDLVKSLDNLNVPEKEKTELLNILGPMKSDIVGK